MGLHVSWVGMVASMSRIRIELWTPDGYPFRQQAENALSDIERMRDRDGRWPSVYVFVTSRPSLADIESSGSACTDTLRHREAVCPKCKGRWPVFAPAASIGDASPGTCSTCPTNRTIVGSGPARKPLPYGREAVERAIKHCKFWRQPSARDACCDVWRVRQAQMTGARSTPAASWLPLDIRSDTPAELRELLRGMPPRAER